MCGWFIWLHFQHIMCEKPIDAHQEAEIDAAVIQTGPQFMQLAKFYHRRSASALYSVL